MVSILAFLKTHDFLLVRALGQRYRSTFNLLLSQYKLCMTPYI
ncbi:hypothetical protein JOE39_001378 [Pseudomonas sp. PvP100]|nr:hypothetical protein [Pseudomonas sp. PvP007]MBP1193399.1 hypothetical protein [Pseudomonas sp. PvP100]